MFVLNKFMLSCSKVQLMTTCVTFLDCVSGNYWSNTCACDGEIMKGRRHREREAGFLAASLSHWITSHPKSSGRCCTTRPFQVEPILSFIFQVRASLVLVPWSWNCPDTDLVLPTAPTLQALLAHTLCQDCLDLIEKLIIERGLLYSRWWFWSLLTVNMSDKSS